MRLVLVSNRLPVTVVRKDGELTFEESVGGLATGLRTYLDSAESLVRSSEYTWVGWPGLTAEESEREELKSRAYSEFGAYPVFLSEEEMDKFYHGFCNKTIWALFHYFPVYAVYDQEYWLHYKQVNEIFCRVVQEIIKPGDMIWIHDYHLMLLPQLLRNQLPDVPIGFFLHIPFPSFEVFRLLPSSWRREILEGLLGADLIGFHTHDYVQYFLRCVQRILGHEHNMGEILLKDRVSKADTFPMGIDFRRFYEAAGSPEVRREAEELKQSLTARRVILSIDRLDYSKGIAHRLRGYEAFLEKNPQWHSEVVLLLVVVPSRIGVEQYQVMKNQIDEIVGRINGRFARIRWTPILYQYRSLPFHRLVTLYSISDIILVTPLRDGMNLIAKEYIASRTDQTGVLILSEMAGAAKELGEAIIINPNNVEEIADSLKEALEMPSDEQIRRNRAMQLRLRRYNVVRWANDFIQSLITFREVQRKLDARMLGPGSREKLIADYLQAKRRLILLDYDGTLVPFAGRPESARPGQQLLDNLRRLGGHTGTVAVLISGRDRGTLQGWFGDVGVELVAEHGIWVKQKNEDWSILKPATNEWKSQIMPVFEIYADRLPGSFVEEKDFSIVYHYREADQDLASIRVKELTDNLAYLTSNIEVQVLRGSKVVEMRNAGANKGTAALHFLSADAYDFILAIGDDWTDEDLFRVLPESAWSIRVGIAPSHAKYNLRSHVDVLTLIEEIANTQ